MRNAIKKNDHLSYVINNITGHIPMLHFKFIKDVYNYLKHLSKVKPLLINKNFNKNELNTKVTNKSDTQSNSNSKSIPKNMKNFTIPQSVLLKNDKKSFTDKKNNLENVKFETKKITKQILTKNNIFTDNEKNIQKETSLGLNYEKLSPMEKESVYKSFKEITQNMNKIMKKSDNRFLDKCLCIDQILKKYIKEYGFNVKLQTAKSNLLKYFRDKSFVQFILDQGGCCGEICANRMVKIECSEQICDCKDIYCNNRYSRGRFYEHLDIVKTEGKGYGLVSSQFIKKKEYIIEYCGEVIDHADMIERLIDSTNDFYLMNIEGDYYLDAKKCGNKSRFINHSCEPNAYLEKWIGQDKTTKILIFAKNDIPAGTEITYNYNFAYIDKATTQECKCGSAKCIGVIGKSKFNKDGGRSNISNSDSKINNFMKNLNKVNLQDLPSLENINSFSKNSPVSNKNISINLNLFLNDKEIVKNVREKIESNSIIDTRQPSVEIDIQSFSQTNNIINSLNSLNDIKNINEISELNKDEIFLDIFKNKNQRSVIQIEPIISIDKNKHEEQITFTRASTFNNIINNPSIQFKTPKTNDFFHCLNYANYNYIEYLNKVKSLGLKNRVFLMKNINTTRGSVRDNFFNENRQYFLSSNNFLEFFTCNYMDYNTCTICKEKVL